VLGVVAALALLVACDDGSSGPEIGTPGLEPPRGVDDGGVPVSENTGGRGSGAAGGADSPTTSPGGSAGAGTVIPPLVGAGGAGGAAGAPDTLTDSLSCEPIGETLDPLMLSQLGESCGTGTTPESGLPNYDNVSIVDLPLTTPLEPGRPYAITLSPPVSGTIGGLEIWGSEDACGPVDELLWYGDMEGRAQCVELMPTRPHSRLQFVTRMLEPLDGVFLGGPGAVALCPGGSCPAGSDGHPLEPGVVLEPPIGVYEMGCSSNGFNGVACETGVLGQMLLIDDPAREAESTFDYSVYASGVFRMPPNDPYGDAWYCLGAGSDMLEDSGRHRRDVHLEAISKLPACEGGDGSASFEWMTSQASIAVTSDVAELAGPDFYSRARCFFDRCTFTFRDSAADTSTHLYVIVDGDVNEGDGPVDLQVLEAAWFTVPASGTPVRRACSTSGALHYDHEGVSSVELDAIGDFVSCPGEPLPDAVLDLIGG
jgi:hypothetical protein